MLGSLMGTKQSLIVTILLLNTLIFPITILALPQDGQVVSGQATISVPDPLNMQINQATNKAIINWQQFSIAAPEAVQFIQPGAASIALNRVIGLDPSLLYGSLSANGRIWLLNPSGILVGPSGKINVNSFLASTLNLDDEAFLSQNTTFNYDPAMSLTSIVNQGTISAADGGHVSLIAPAVHNQGSIIANLGKVHIGAGEQMTLRFAGNESIGFTIDQPLTGQALGPEGQPLDEVLNNTGTITADGGEIVLSARTAFDAIKAVVNNEGMIQARTISNQNGVIKLEGGEQGIVFNSGTLDASGENPGETGGTVQVTGEKVGLVHYSKIKASGAAGGGKVFIGGGFQGKDPVIRNGRITYVSKDATIEADALEEGDGGQVVVWADEATHFNGSITARGGEQSGDGGFVEVSGKSLEYQGTIDAKADNGAAGTVLFDPTDIVVSDADDTDGASGGDVLFGDTPSAEPWYVTPAQLNTVGGNIILQAENDITFTNNVALTTGSLAVQAGRHVDVDGDITTASGAIHLEADSPHSTGGSSGTGDVDILAGVTVNSNGGGITLIGDDFIIGGNIDAGSGSVNIARTSGNAINIGGGSEHISQNELDRMSTSANLTIGQATTAGAGGVIGSGTAITATTITVAGNTTVANTSGSTTLNLIANDGITVDSNLTTNQTVNINADADAGDDDGTFSNNADIDSNDADIAIIADDMVISGTGDTINAGTGTISVNVSDGGTIGLNTAADLSLPANRLDQITTSAFTLSGTDSTISVGDISNFASSNIDEMVLDATNSGASIIFNGDATFNTLSARANNGITVNANDSITTDIGLLRLDTTNANVDLADNSALTGVGVSVVASSGVLNLSGANGSTNAITTTGNGNDILLPAVTVSNSPDLTLISDDNLSLNNINIGATGTLSATVDDNSNSTSTLFLGTGLIAGSIDLTGNNNDTLSGGNTWNIDGNNLGTVDGKAYSGFENLTGTAAGDTFIFGASGDVSGTINGAAGPDSINYSALGSYTANLGSGIVNIETLIGAGAGFTLSNGSTWSITGLNSGTVDSINFSGFEDLTGTSGNNSFTLSGGSVGSIDGLGGTDTLTASNVVNTWNITNPDQGSVNGTGSFSSIENLVGGTNDDQIVFDSTGSISGMIDGSTHATADTADYSLVTNAVIVDLGNVGFINIEGVIGDGTNDTLVADNLVNTWNITAANDGTINAGAPNQMIFTDFSNLTGGTNNDSFIFGASGAVNGVIDGAIGSDSINYSALGAYTATLGTGIVDIETLIGAGAGFALSNGISWSITGPNTGTVDSIAFTGFANLSGTGGNDSFTINGGSVSSINGQGGTDTLTAGDIANTWNIINPDEGSVNSVGSFTSIEDLVGGNHDDQFIFGNAGSISGTVDGNAHITADIADYSIVDNTVTVTIGNTGLSNVEVVAGDSGNDILVGDNIVNTWDVTALNGGTINSGISFIGFSNLEGGSDVDNFNFIGGSVSQVNGAGGTNAVTINNALVTGTDINITNAALTVNADVTSDGGFGSSGGTVTLGANIFTDGNDVTFGNDVVLSTDVEINTGTLGGNIQFSGAIGGAATDSQSLDLTAGTGQILLSGDVGTTRLNNLNIIRAGGVQANGSISANSLTINNGGVIDLNAAVTLVNGFTSQSDSFNNDGTIVDAGAGDIEIRTSGDITVGGLRATNDINITSTGGAIFDDGNEFTEIETTSIGGSLELNASSGIGDGNDLETQVSNLDARSTSGAIVIDEQDDIILTFVSTDGDINIEATDNITASVVTALGGNTIQLTSTGGNMRLGTVTAIDGTINLSANQDIDYGKFNVDDLGTAIINANTIGLNQWVEADVSNENLIMTLLGEVNGISGRIIAGPSMTYIPPPGDVLPSGNLSIPPGAKVIFDFSGQFTFLSPIIANLEGALASLNALSTEQEKLDKMARQSTGADFFITPPLDLYIDMEDEEMEELDDSVSLLRPGNFDPAVWADKLISLSPSLAAY